MTDEPISIVLVHGGFVDGSGWQGVHDILTKDGYEVIVVQNPTLTLADDVAYTKRAIAAATHPVVLVGHSYGGVIITEAGNDPKVSSLVYIAAFAADAGESVQTLIANPPPGVAVPPILPPKDGFLFLDREKFAMSTQHWPISWRTPRCRGASMPQQGKSRPRRGGQSQATIS
jgi:pimeloyl-ACP methyl ester carboxylesterase